jgi:hypothetical protein
VVACLAVPARIEPWNDIEEVQPRKNILLKHTALYERLRAGATPHQQDPG